MKNEQPGKGKLGSDLGVKVSQQLLRAYSESGDLRLYFRNQEAVCIVEDHSKGSCCRARWENPAAHHEEFDSPGLHYKLHKRYKGNPFIGGRRSMGTLILDLRYLFLMIFCSVFIADILLTSLPRSLSNVRSS
jgi:hypothetical protein